MRSTGLALLLAGLTGCYTTFTGSSMVKNGPVGCRATCEGWGMELAGMVKMGEYSDGCICQVKPKAPAQGPASEAPAPGSPSATSIPAAAGVYMQMQMVAAAGAAQQSGPPRQSQGASWRSTPPPGAPR